MLYKLLSLDPAPHSRSDIFVGRRAVGVVMMSLVKSSLTVSVGMHVAAEIRRPAAHSTDVRVLHGPRLSEIIVPLGSERIMRGEPRVLLVGVSRQVMRSHTRRRPQESGSVHLSNGSKRRLQRRAGGRRHSGSRGSRMHRTRTGRGGCTSKCRLECFAGSLNGLDVAVGRNSSILGLPFSLLSLVPLVSFLSVLHGLGKIVVVGSVEPSSGSGSSRRRRNRHQRRSRGVRRNQLRTRGGCGSEHGLRGLRRLAKSLGTGGLLLLDDGIVGGRSMKRQQVFANQGSDLALHAAGGVQHGLRSRLGSSMEPAVVLGRRQSQRV